MESITSETIVIGVVVVLAVVVMWKFLVGFLKLGLSIFLLVAIVWGGYMILQHAGADFSSLNKVSSDVTKTVTKHTNDAMKQFNK